MSSQHLEEADALADRVCVLTKGQILALDSPSNIKKRFGVGYKILIEPKLASDQFKLKSSADSLLTPYFQPCEMAENNESSSKKLIYGFPFS